MNILGSLPIGTLLAIYFVVWSISLFAVLPLGVRSQDETGDVAPGTDPGAPVAPDLARKILITSLIAVPASGLVYGLIAFWV